MRIVVTGGPGTGKTTLLLALRDRGHTVVEETARGVIRARRADGLPPRPSPREFAEAILRRDVEQYERHSEDTLVFFDRGILDALGMLVEAAPERLAECEFIASRYRYHGTVFVPPPWEDIFTTDAERDQTFADAVRVHEGLVGWYGRFGYRVCEVPRLPVDERCDFVLSALAGGHGSRPL